MVEESQSGKFTYGTRDVATAEELSWTGIHYYTLENDKVSIKDKAIIIGALGYLISPLDVVPDAIPIAGLGDDLAVLIYVLHKVWGDVSEEVKNKARAKLSMWFDTDEINVTDDIFKDTPDNAPV
ncbi:MAG: DUF1232 domain-containing protein [Prevotella sp.]|nr:DUF1232 domain-containing protein [Prevotella sp.]